MTFSIVARDPATAMMGVAVSTRNLAVGALVPFARAGVGAIATQALTNPLLGIRGLDLLEQASAPRVLEQLIQQDDGRQHRQLHLIDRQGTTAAWTGLECVAWAGHLEFPGFSVAGNMLVSEATLAAMAASYQENASLSFCQRLLTALLAGQRAGGDKRGRQSAALYVVDQDLYAELDLRVDDHPDPVTELQRLYHESQQDYYQRFRRSLPSWRHPAGRFDADADLIDSLVTPPSPDV